MKGFYSDSLFLTCNTPEKNTLLGKLPLIDEKKSVGLHISFYYLSMNIVESCKSPAELQKEIF